MFVESQAVSLIFTDTIEICTIPCTISIRYDVYRMVSMVWYRGPYVVVHTIHTMVYHGIDTIEKVIKEKEEHTNENIHWNLPWQQVIALSP